MSTLTYNGITLPYPYTTAFEQKVVYDESNTDWMCTKFDIQVQAVLNAAYMDIIAPEMMNAANPDDAAAVMNAIRKRLLQPRRTLSFRVNGTELIPPQTANSGLSTQGSGMVDVRNGPQPQSCGIVQLNSVTFLITYHITAHYWETATAIDSRLNVTNTAGNTVLSNRWTETVDIDNRLISTRTREGKFVIRSDNNTGVTADEVRSQMAVVGIPTGFMRQSSRYTITPDGLGIQYRVVDKEYFKVPPSPAYEASGTYTETTTSNGAVRFGEVRITLKGNESSIAAGPFAGRVAQARMAEVAITIAAYKLWLNGSGINRGLFTAFGSSTPIGLSLLKHASLRVGIWENTVEFNILAQMTGSRRRLAGVPIGANIIGPSSTIVYTPVVDDPGTTPPPYTMRGSAGLLLQAAKYYDPSLSATGMGPGFAFSANDNPVINTTDSNLTAGVFVGQAGVRRET